MTEAPANPPIKESARDARDTIQVSDKLRLMPIRQEHNIEALQDNLEEVRSQIRASDGVVLEYFPPEMDATVKRVAGQGTTLEYFTKVSKMAAEEGKDVLCFDPCHDESFFELGVVMLGYPMGAAAAGVGGQVLESKLPENTQKKFSRREFLKKMSSFLLLTGIAGNLSNIAMAAEHKFKKPINAAPHYQSIRRAIVARGLVQHGEELDKQEESQQYALFYPPTHEEGIESFVNNPELLSRYFGAVSQLKKVSKSWKESFFTMRRYRWTQQGWEQTEKKEIE